MKVPVSKIEDTVAEALDVSEKQRAVSIDPIAADSPRVVSQELVRLPADLSYYNGVFADVLEYQILCKRERDRVEAERVAHYRKTTEPPPGARVVTDAFIQALVSADPLVTNAQNLVDTADVWKARLSGIVDAIRSKEKALTSIAMLMQAEIRVGHHAGAGDAKEDDTASRERRIWGGR